MKEYSADHPVSLRNEDRFQRYEFSKRIAGTILNRQNRECLVIGIHGIWGEGKTSVMNFAEQELLLNEDVILIKFNPWRFSNEEAILLSFFNKLANKLGEKLKSAKQEIGQVLSDYGKFLTINLPIIGNVIDIGGIAQKGGEALSKASVEDLKDKLNTILIEQKKKVVVFIDDIDRLDKSEIQTVFRLVKLNADFANTTYLLSFDENVVANSLAEKFGKGDYEAGRSFLEKIVQVSLRIPKAQPEALQKVCFDVLNQTFSQNDITLSRDEEQRFAFDFFHCILPKIDTPRAVLRYANSVSFFVPLMNGEVNIVDLLLLEALKICYPTHYEFIRNNDDLFLGSFTKVYTGDRDEDKVRRFTDALMSLNTGLTNQQQEGVMRLLEQMFPAIGKALHAHGSGNFYNAQLWEREKRICSKNYFSRYFTYTVQTGDISDSVFSEFLKNVDNLSVASISENIVSMIESSSPERFLNKLRLLQVYLDWRPKSKLVKALCLVSSKFPSAPKDQILMSFETAIGQAVFLIVDIFRAQHNKEECYALAIFIINESETFEFVIEALRWIDNRQDTSPTLFSNDQYSSLGKELKIRVLKESGNEPFFKVFPDLAFKIVHFWVTYNQYDFHTYLASCLKQDPNNVILLLYTLAPTIKSNSLLEPFKGDLDEQRYQGIISMIEENLIINELNETLGKGFDFQKELLWVERNEHQQTPENVARQFLFWYSKKSNSLTPHPGSD